MTRKGDKLCRCLSPPFLVPRYWHCFHVNKIRNAFSNLTFRVLEVSNLFVCIFRLLLLCLGWCHKTSLSNSLYVLVSSVDVKLLLFSKEQNLIIFNTMNIVYCLTGVPERLHHQV